MTNNDTSLSTSDKLKLLAGELYSAANAGMWCYVSKENIFYSTSLYEQDYQKLLVNSDCLSFAENYPDGLHVPAILSDDYSLMWIAEHSFKEKKKDMLFLIGPFFLSYTSMGKVDNLLQGSAYSMEEREELMKAMKHVPMVNMSMLHQYAIMLHFVLTGESIAPRQFHHQRKEDAARVKEYQTFPDTPVSPEQSAREDEEIKSERLLLQAIREGNQNIHQIMDEQCNFGGMMAVNTGDSLRDGKNTVLIFCALAFRAAIDGGVPAYTAKERERYYENRVEDCANISQLTRLNNQIIQECVDRVRACRASSRVSPIIQECCDYIKANLLKPLTADSLARHFGYTEYYFTKKFYREMNIRLNDYIKEARIEYAKIALMTTHISIQELSDSLQFGTRNYFSKVFHDIVGMTPAAYREKTDKLNKKI
jgi:YesN/AraC family two-component response regulator